MCLTNSDSLLKCSQATGLLLKYPISIWNETGQRYDFLFMYQIQELFSNRCNVNTRMSRSSWMRRCRVSYTAHIGYASMIDFPKWSYGVPSTMGLVVTPSVTRPCELGVSRNSTSGLHLVRRIKMTGALSPCAFMAWTAKHDFFLLLTHRK
jgi:hypothetical protein